MFNYRRLLSVLLAATLLCMAAVPAMAAGGFDMTPFNLHDYMLDMSEEDYGYLVPNTYFDPLRNHGRINELSLSSKSYFSYAYPYIYMTFSNYKVNLASYIIIVELANDIYPSLNVTSVEIFAGGKTYLLTIPSNHRSSGTKSGSSTYYEDIYIYIDEENREMMDAIVALREPVKCIAHGSNVSVEFTLGQNIIDTVADMYTNYLAAGGFFNCLNGTKVVVQDPLDRFLGETTPVKTPLTDYAAGKTTTGWIARGQKTANLVTLLGDHESAAHLASLLAYDLFSANYAWADVLGYAYGNCYVGMANDGAVHVAIQTASSTYYIVRTDAGTTVSVKTGADKLTDAQLTAEMIGLGVVYIQVDSAKLMASVIKQSNTLAEYNAAQGGLQ